MKKKVLSIVFCLVLMFAVTQVIRISLGTDSAQNAVSAVSTASSSPSSVPNQRVGGEYQPITVSPEPENGTVFVDHRRAQKGETIEITLTPDEGFKEGTVVVTSGRGENVPVEKTENGTYTFSMPTTRAYVSATFVKEGGTVIENDDAQETKPLYNDVDEADEYYEAIRYVTDHDLMEGVSGGSFAKDAVLSRAMLVTILYRLEGTPAVDLVRTFTDVQPGSIYEKPILWARDKGIVNGYSETEFGPDDSVTRQQVATIMYRYAQLKGYDVSVGEDTNILSYEDVDDVFEYAIAPYQYVLGTGIMPAKSETKLNPDNYVSRGEFAEILMRFNELNQ